MQGEKEESIVELAATIAGKADQIDDILVLYTMKSDEMAHSLDNGISVGSALYLMESFKHWVMSLLTPPKKSS